MPLARTVLTPLAIEISSGALDRLTDVLAAAHVRNERLAVAVGPGMGASLAPVIEAQLPHADIHTIEAGTFDAAMALAGTLRTYGTVIGVGGGKVIDTVKCAATQLGMPMIAVPTSLAHDGVASPVSTLRRGDQSVSYGVHIPLAVVVDLDVVARSPRDQLRGGVGDAISNLSACADWQLSHAVTGEPLDGLALSLAQTGANAVLHHPGDVRDQDFQATLAQALIQGGIAMAMAGSSRPCSGACHEITHALEALHPGATSHGIGAGIGALFATHLRARAVGGVGGADHKSTAARYAETFGRMAATMKRHGLPVTPAGIGLTDEQFVAVVLHAPATRPGRLTILEHLALDAPATSVAVKEYIDAVQ
jgi:glycerol-1-phosphate dehydrogenase [NAD(P)+]